MITTRFSRVELKGAPLQVGKVASEEEINELFSFLSEIDANVQIGKMLQKDIDQCADLLQYLSGHARARRYMFQLRKCDHAPIDESHRIQCVEVCCCKL